MKRLTAVLTGLALFIGLIVAATPAEAATFISCPAGLEPLITCTRVIGPVTIKDRQNNALITWQTGTSIAMGHWTVDPYGQCGTHGDSYVWSVYWLHIDWGILHVHSTVIGDTWLQTGLRSDWGPHLADKYGNVFDPWYRLSTNANPGTCDGAGWDFLITATPNPWSG